MSEIDLQSVKKRSLLGIITLSGRTFLLQIVALLATFMLTVFLDPKEYGVFFIVSAAVNFLVYFSDIGLAAALIQKKNKLGEKDLATTFTIQQSLVITITIVSFMLSGRIAQFYNLNGDGLWLLRALIISFFLSSLKTIPSILLERKLKFDKLVIPQILETIVFYAVAVFMAWQSKGVASFTLAVILRGLVGLISIYSLMPWRPRLAFDKASAKKLLSFGMPFQANSLLALLKDDLLIAFLGKILPFAQVGFIGWAQKWAFFPLRFFMDAINKVTFPAYSRLQDNKDILVKAINKSIYGISLTVFPILTGLALLAPYFVDFFPKYGKWQPALPALFFFCLGGIFSSVSTTLTNTLNAIGKIKITLYLMIFWTVLTWVLTIGLIKVWGFSGVAMASALTAMTVFLPIIAIKKYLAIKVLANTIRPLIATLSMAGLVYFLSPLFVTSLFKLVIMVLIGAFVYFFGIFIIDSKRIKQEFHFVLKSIK